MTKEEVEEINHRNEGFHILAGEGISSAIFYDYENERLIGRWEENPYGTDLSVALHYDSDGRLQEEMAYDEEGRPQHRTVLIMMKNRPPYNSYL